jgi:hypothetical protein
MRKRRRWSLASALSSVLVVCAWSAVVGCRSGPEQLRGVWKAQSSELQARATQLEVRGARLAADARKADAQSTARWRADATLRSSAQSLVDWRRTMKEADLRVEQSLRGKDPAAARGVIAAEVDRATSDLQTIHGELESAGADIAATEPATPKTTN